MRRSGLVLIVCLLSVVFVFCSKKGSGARPPKSFQAVPDGVQLVVTLDGKALREAFVSLLGQLNKLVPEEVRRQVPTWQELVSQLKGPTGVDLNSVGDVVAAVQSSPLQREPQTAILVSGLDAKNLKGKKRGDHQGVALYALEEEADAHYAQLAAAQLVVANSEEMLKKAIDTHAGKAKRIAGTSPMLQKLMAEDPDLTHIRAYLLSADLPGMAGAPFKVDGGGMFFDMKKGLGAVVYSDEAGAGRLKAMVEGGIAMARTEMGKIERLMPPGPTAEQEKAMKMIRDFFDSVEVKQDGGKLKVAYRGDQEPMQTIGVLSAIAIPAFISYIRKSKASEVHMLLERCYMGVVEHFDKPQVRPDGTAVTAVLPAAMAEPVCPGDKTIKTLDGESEHFKPEVFQTGGKAAVLGQIGLAITDASYGCYQYTSKAAGRKLKDGETFTCHAWTDLNGDGRPAHWTKTGTYMEATASFRGSAVTRDPSSDEW
jgi:hypothetical protein